MATPNLKTLPVGEIYSTLVNGHHVRREAVYVDRTAFYRFVVNPGTESGFETFYSTDSEKLYAGVLKRLRVKC